VPFFMKHHVHMLCVSLVDNFMSNKVIEMVAIKEILMVNST